MNLLKTEIIKLIKEWLIEWDSYNLEGVMKLMHEDIIFENWTGFIVNGKINLQNSWTLWFNNHGNFKFIAEDLFVDEKEQKVLLRWKLEWPSLEKYYIGKPEIRRGVDIIHFKDGKIYKKLTYSKTTIQIDKKLISLSAQKSNFFD